MPPASVGPMSEGSRSFTASGRCRSPSQRWSSLHLRLTATSRSWPLATASTPSRTPCRSGRRNDGPMAKVGVLKRNTSSEARAGQSPPTRTSAPVNSLGQAKRGFEPLVRQDHRPHGPTRQSTATRQTPAAGRRPRRRRSRRPSAQQRRRSARWRCHRPQHRIRHRIVHERPQVLRRPLLHLPRPSGSALPHEPEQRVATSPQSHRRAAARSRPGAISLSSERCEHQGVRAERFGIGHSTVVSRGAPRSRVEQAWA